MSDKREIPFPSAEEVVSFHVRNKQRGGHNTCWRDGPELPSIDEVMATLPSTLPVNDIDRPPSSKDDYLRIQWSLYRHEGIELLRRAVMGFRQNPRAMEGQDAYIYTQVHATGYHFSKIGAACRLAFSTERSAVRVNWGQSGRLTPGAVIALSPSSDNFATKCIVAVVAARFIRGGLEPDIAAGENQHTPPRIDVFWGEDSAAVIDPTTELVMVEAKSGYYETVRHAMVGLQHAALSPSTLDKYIVEASTDKHAPAYLDEVPDCRAVIPDTAKQFDTSQHQAFSNMTSHEMAVCQGPPGTGKTFTSVVAIQSCVETLKPLQAPIIIAAQTNHALDQLLQLCIQQEIGEVVRLGSRSRELSIVERTMYRIRQSSKLRQADSDGEASRKRLSCRLQNALQTCFPDGLVSAEVLYSEGIISEKQYNSIVEEEWESATVASGQDGVDSASMTRWLDTYVEKDSSYVYVPPQGQIDPEIQEKTTRRDQDYESDDDPRDRLQGEFVPIQLALTGALPTDQSTVINTWWSQAEQLAKRSDLYQIKPAYRGMVYRYWHMRLISKMAASIPNLLGEYREVCDKLKISRWTNNVDILRQEGVQIIGCTTTGLTKYRGMLAAMRPRVLIVEEAAETREANITSTLFPSLQQLILVGDHQQLPPHVDVSILGSAPFNLNVSLFQRLVHLGVPYSTLQVQRRMIPSIREVVQAFYPMLEDHPDVKNPIRRPPVAAMGGRNMWWFQHEWPEKHNDRGAYMNPKEADMIVGFVQYLVQHGIRPSQITVLTYYNGQLNFIQHRLRHKGVEGCLVRTVDGFQGEENDIIILSLVRSPERRGPAHAKVGFVKDENRAVVATSRARRGFYIFGNAQNLLASGSKSRETWQKVFDVFKRQHRTGCLLPVACKMEGKPAELRQPADWIRVLGSKSLCQSCNDVQPNTQPQALRQPSRRVNDGSKTRHRHNEASGRSSRVSRATQREVVQDNRATLLLPALENVAGHLTSDEWIANGYLGFDQRQVSSASRSKSDGDAIQAQASSVSELLIDTGVDTVSEVAAMSGSSSPTPHLSPSLRLSGSQISTQRSSAMSSPQKTESLQEMWTAEVVADKEATLRLRLQEDSMQPGPESTTIRETYRQTTTDSAGYRVHGAVPSIQMEHMHGVAPDAVADGQPPGRVDNGHDSITRKGQLLEAISGVKLPHKWLDEDDFEITRKGQLLDDAAGFGSPNSLPCETSEQGERNLNRAEVLEVGKSGILIEFD